MFELSSITNPHNIRPRIPAKLLRRRRHGVTLTTHVANLRHHGTLSDVFMLIEEHFSYLGQFGALATELSFDVEGFYQTIYNYIAFSFVLHMLVQ